MEDCFYLGEKETKQEVTEYFVYLGSEENAVTPAFNDMEELRDHLANRGTDQGQPWSMGAVILLEEHKKIPREIGFIKPYNSNYRQQHESWKEDGGECGSNTGQGRVGIKLGRGEDLSQPKTLCLTPSATHNIIPL